MTRQETLLLTEAQKSRFFYGYVVVLAAFIIIAVSYSAMYSYGVFFKPVSSEFGWTRATMSGAASLCSLLFGLFGIITGRLSDRLGPRLVIATCGFFLGLGYLLMSLIGAVWQLYLFYGLIVAIGMSGGFTPLTSTVGRWFIKRRGLMTGIVVAGIGGGTMIGPPVATWLISNHEWRTSFAILGGILLVSVILAAQFLRRDPGQVGLLPYGEAEATSNNLVRHNLGSEEAREFSINEAVKTKQFWMIVIIDFCLVFGLSVIMIHVVPYATDVGISDMTAAKIMSIIGITSMLGRPAMGIIADRIGNKLSMIIGFILFTATLFWLLVAKEVWSLCLFAAVYGFGYGGLIALLPLIVAQFFGLSSYGAILGVVVFGGSVGGAVGPVLAGWIFDFSNSYYLAFLITAVLAGLALVLTLLVSTPQKIGGSLEGSN